MSANIKINANSSEFNRQMAEMARELNKVKSSYNLANTQAKLFGSTTDVLRSKQSELTSKINVQNRMIETQSKHLRDLNKDLANQKSERDRLNAKIEETNRKYQESVNATGKNSEESKKLKSELKELKEAQSKNNTEIDSTVKKLDNAEVKLNNSQKSLMKNQKALEEVNKELEKSKLDKFSEGLEKSSQKAEHVSNKMKPASTAIVGLGTAATIASMNFQDGVANINTLLDDHSHLDGYKNKIMDVSNETGISIDVVTDGMYQAISSIGDGGAETEKIFDTMANSAKAGGAEVKDAVALISAGMKGYNQVNDETAKKIGDLAFQTAKLGVTTFPEMAASMQPLFPLASNLNLSMTDLFTDMSTLTGVTGNTSEVCTQLKAVFSNLIKPTTDMQKLMKKYGYSNGQAMLKQEGLIGTMKILQKETGGQSDKMGKLFSSTEGLTAITALTGSQFDTMTEKSKKMSKALGTTDSVLKIVNNTTKNDLRTSLNQAKNSLIGFGDIIAPFVSKVARGLSGITKAINGLTPGQKNLVVGLGAGFVATNLAIGAFAKLAKGLSNNIKFMQKSKTAIKDYVKATKDGETKIVKFGKGVAKVSRNIKDFTVNIGKKAVQGLKSFGKGLLTVTKNLGKFAISIGKTAVKGILAFGKGLLTVTKNLGKLTLAILKNSAQLTKNGLMWLGTKAKMLAFKGAQLAVTGATKAMTLAQKGLNLVMSMNPIGIVITALVSLAAVFVTLYNKCDWFRNGVNAVWSKVKSIFVGFANFFKGAFHRDFTRTFGLLGVPLNHFFSVVGTVWNGIKGVFNGVLTFLSGVFTGNWRKIFSGLKQIISSIFGTIGGIIKAPINAAISGINSAIRAVNRISFNIPNWVPVFGGKHFGIHLPTIPALAEGGIVTKATMALVGEGKEHEAVIPLSKLDKLVTNSVQKVLDNRGNKTYEKNNQETKIIQINLQVGSKNVAEAIFDEFGNLISKNQRSRGIARGRA
ncbi:TP901 family phage tail tape measure protein [[Clostridium] sordellii]|uniref:phage tail tape measure protein n=1 Tax=Paraclostridium sordellii TaxID=1505 RepID=UPI0005E132DD|nr:phage tail tape measure protein [Paeniclostridium sordellii]CEN29831.1 TP901 family phage tail tape measure protein [[Clostridium] sordellii] [Paeniclostridium sordellii]CEN30386.1 TP901 family phage tail tape measure protein [[Clostridium] sordellii] [Paeniclostridium sordellii]